MSRWPVSVRRARDRLHRRKWGARAFDELIDRYRGDRCSRSWFMLCWGSSFDSPAWKNNSGSLIFPCYAFIWFFFLIELLAKLLHVCFVNTPLQKSQMTFFIIIPRRLIGVNSLRSIDNFFFFLYLLNIWNSDCRTSKSTDPFLFIYVSYVDNFTLVDVTFALQKYNTWQYNI